MRRALRHYGCAYDVTRRAATWHCRTSRRNAVTAAISENAFVTAEHARAAFKQRRQAWRGFAQRTFNMRVWRQPWCWRLHTR